jgi:chromosome transmission fidelity protein 8
MEGKIVSLPKPLAVLQRVCAPSTPPPPPPTTTTDGEADLEGDVEMRHSGDASDRDAGDDNSVPAATSYAIRTLIRKKIVFSKRPTPIVGLSAKIENDVLSESSAELRLGRGAAVDQSRLNET